MKYDLVVAYRIYPGISKIPPAYPNNKYELSRMCLESFKQATVGLKVKIYALLDGCPKEYEDLFRENFSPADLEIIPLDRCGNKETFRRQIDILSQQIDSDVVYFAEDDYFYIENIRGMISFLKEKDVDFVTPYEHPAIYMSAQALCSNIRLFEGRRYVSTQHACLTFMTTKKNLLKNRRYFLIFSNWFGSDFVVWGCIALGVNYFKYLKLLFRAKNFNKENFKVFGSMFFFAWQRFLLNKKYALYMPIQTYATHMESDFLSPGINWDVYFKNKK